jgi:hypothetical protein
MKVIILAVLVASPLVHAESCFLVESVSQDGQHYQQAQQRELFNAESADSASAQTKNWRATFELDRNTQTMQFSIEQIGVSPAPVRGAVESVDSLTRAEGLGDYASVGPATVRAEIVCR